MYRQIKVIKDQRNYQRILWREKPDLPIKTYQLTTVTYGTVPASFLAIGCLHKLAELKHNEYPIACDVIARDFYIDDLLSGAPTKREVIKLQNDLVEILGEASMRLSKWSSNNNEILENIMQSNENEGKCLNPDLKKIRTSGKIWGNEKNKDISKILGLMWDFRDDTFRYQIKKNFEINKPTKRNILAYIASIFDPLGLVGPVVLCSKILLQNL
jgi:hypothetical protein